MRLYEFDQSSGDDGSQNGSSSSGLTKDLEGLIEFERQSRTNGGKPMTISASEIEKKMVALGWTQFRVKDLQGLAQQEPFSTLIKNVNTEHNAIVLRAPGEEASAEPTQPNAQAPDGEKEVGAMAKRALSRRG